MKIAILLILALSFPNAFADSFAAASFMKGCWGAIDEDGNHRMEDWSFAANDALGTVQTRDGQNNMAGDHGFQELKLDEKGNLLLIASFIGHPVNTFSMSQAAAASVSFTLQHSESPALTEMQIVYNLKSADTLHVQYSGNADSGQPDGDFDFGYDLSRQDCTSRF